MESAPGIIDILRGLLGVAALVGILYLLSNNRKAIDWKLVGAGLLLQLIFALGVLKVEFVRDMFQLFADVFVQITTFTEAGAKFVFGDWPNTVKVTQVNPDGTEQFRVVGYIFAVKVLPTVIFFSALSSLLYYLGILQRIVWVFAWVMSKTMRLSGSESLSASANIFLGQTEAPLLIKPYLPTMTKSEILCVMIGGMATIAGGVLAAYVGFLGGDDVEQQKFYAMHLLSASIMSAPAAIVASKMLFPQVEHDKIDRNIIVSKEKVGTNLLDAISNGTTDGLKLAVNVGAMLIAFTALIAMLNYICYHWIGGWTGLNAQISSTSDYNGFTLQYIFGLVFSPIAWLLGTSSKEMVPVGQLLGEKTILNEFFAYSTLGTMKATSVLTDTKSIIIATYALCGFSNFSSIGIQIGGIGALAPSQRPTVAALGIKALIGGTIACFFTAAIAGMLIG